MDKEEADKILIMITKPCSNCKKNRLIRTDGDECLWCAKKWPIAQGEIYEITTNITEENIEKEWWNRYTIQEEQKEDEIYKKYQERQVKKAKKTHTREDIEEILVHMEPELETVVNEVYKEDDKRAAEEARLTIDRECKTHHFNENQRCKACKILALEFYVNGTQCVDHTHRVKAQQLA